jgi:hypothetical protein
LQAPSPWGDLEEVLARAATKDRTVIMTQINAAWTRPGSLLDLFFESFRTGEDGVARLLDHLVIVTMDPAAYEGCKAVHRHCYFLRTSNGVDYRSEKMFMSKDYLEMMWGRNRFQQTVLELGYNFLFTVSTVHLFFRIFVVANNGSSFINYARVTRANDVSSLRGSTHRRWWPNNPVVLAGAEPGWFVATSAALPSNGRPGNVHGSYCCSTWTLKMSCTVRTSAGIVVM